MGTSTLNLGIGRQSIPGPVGGLSGARGLAWRLAVRAISAHYRQTFLGYLWTLLPAAMITLVWVTLEHAAVVHIGSGEVL